jgi:hypothetical protein
VERKSLGCYEQTRSVCCSEKSQYDVDACLYTLCHGGNKAVSSESQLAGDEKKAPDSAGSGGCMNESKLTDASL